MKKRAIGLSLILCVALLLLPGCVSREPGNANIPGSAQKPTVTADADTVGEGSAITLSITRNFGHEVLDTRRIAASKGETALDLLKANASVSTEYGGAFVTAINGVKAGSDPRYSGWAWIYTVNGLTPAVAASECPVNPGDVVWWDFRPFSETGTAGFAVIGAYPHPLREAEILFAPKNESEGTRLSDSLGKKWGTRIERNVIDEKKISQRSRPIVVVGEWKNLASSPYLSGLNRAGTKGGLWVRFLPSALEILDYQGKKARDIHGSAGLVCAVSFQMGDRYPLWMVTGTDAGGLKAAVEMAAEHPERLSNCCGAVIFNGQVIKLPAANQD